MLVVGLVVCVMFVYVAIRELSQAEPIDRTRWGELEEVEGICIRDTEWLTHTIHILELKMMQKRKKPRKRRKRKKQRTNRSTTATSWI